MKVASDLDHVMCDLVGQARVVLAGDLGVPVDDIVQTYVYHNSLAHADPAINARIRVDQAFWEREEVMYDARPMPGALEAAWRLYDAGMLVAYVTRRGPNVRGATIDWLRRGGFPPVPAHFVGTCDPTTSYATCKTAACLRAGADILLDDSQDEVERVVEAGLSAILLDAPVGREARRLFTARRPDILCLPSVVEAADHLLAMRVAARAENPTREPSASYMNLENPKHRRGLEMKITTERSVLLRALSHANSIVERRNTIPILSNVMLRGEDGRLTIVATDLDIQITESIEATIEQPGGTTVASSTLFDIVRKLPDGAQVQLATDGAQLIVMAGRSRFKLNVLPTDDFPMIAAGDLPHEVDITASQLSEMIDDTKFAMSTEETRYYLNGIFFHVKDGMLKAAATDGHRLALSAISYQGAPVPDIIVPRKTVAEVRKLLGEVDGDLQVHLSNTKIRFDMGRVVLTSKLIDGTFPDYTRVIPTSNDKVMTTDVSTLSSAADRVAIVSSDKTRALTMEVGRDAVKLIVVSPETGTATDEVPADCRSELRIGFNSRYLGDILGQIATEEVEFHFNDATSPVLIRQKEPSSPDREKKFVLMPMRT